MGMTLNASKTVAINFTNKKKPLNFSYKLGNLGITRTDHIKYLGVTLTSNLTWEPHLETICSKVRRKLPFVKRRLSYVPSYVKLTTYKTLIRPDLEYSDIIWSIDHKFFIKKLRVRSLAVWCLFSSYSRHTNVTALCKKA